MKMLTNAFPQPLCRQHFGVLHKPKLVGCWQDGIETMSGHAQWKLRLTFAHSPSPAFAAVNDCRQP
jgi:hypothetical protein